MAEQVWEGFRPQGTWTATVRLYQDGAPMGEFDLSDVEVLETAAGDLDPETGLPLDISQALAIRGLFKDLPQNT